jgi:hypothetical protein
MLWKKVMFLISSAALRTNATHTVDVEILPQNVSIPGKNCVRHKLLQDQI